MNDDKQQMPDSSDVIPSLLPSVVALPLRLSVFEVFDSDRGMSFAHGRYDQ